MVFEFGKNFPTHTVKQINYLSWLFKYIFVC